jgi:hypothetical protein
VRKRRSRNKWQYREKQARFWLDCSQRSALRCRSSRAPTMVERNSEGMDRETGPDRHREPTGMDTSPAGLRLRQLERFRSRRQTSERLRPGRQPLRLRPRQPGRASVRPAHRRTRPLKQPKDLRIVRDREVFGPSGQPEACLPDPEGSLSGRPPSGANRRSGEGHGPSQAERRSRLVDR